MKYSKVIFLCSVFCMLLFQYAFSQELSGTVLDENNEPLAGAEVYVPALQRGTTTNAEGYFILKNIPGDVYTVRFSFLGYKAETLQLNFGDAREPLRINLKSSALNLPDITVTSGPQPQDVLSSSQSVSTLDASQLQKNRDIGIIASLKDLPGVSTYTTGNGIVKPVIRGLTSQRVVVVDDGVRQEGQQWGDEHAPEIDAFDVKRIEVVRGPSSVLYGSDALGGVINIIKPDLPYAKTGDPQLAGNLDLNGYSNNDLLGGALSLYGASGRVGYRAEFTGLNSGNTSTPNGTLANTGTNEANGSLMLGTTQDWGNMSLDYSHFDQHIEILENPAEEPGATPFQIVQHDKIHFALNRPFNRFRLEANGAYQRNDRREFKENNATDPALNLILDTGTINIKVHHQPIGPFFGTVGLSGMTQHNRSIAEEKLIPGFTSYNLAGFIYEELPVKSFNFSGGLRFDSRILDIEETPELNVPSEQKNYNQFSGTFGAVWRISEPFAFSVNLGRAWRAPTAYELYVDGVHEGTARFEIGDSNFSPETSVNIDGSLKYVSGKFQSELAVYNNEINNYIFPNPTDTFDPDSGFRKYQYEQADARIYGLEYSLQAQARKWLILSGGYNIVRGMNQRICDPLPLIPADNFELGAKLTTKKIGSMLNPYFSLKTRIFSKQNRVADFETETDGYTLVDASIGTDIATGSQKINIILQADNIFNEAYRSNLSRYKEYALNPGRNIKLKVQIPFGITK